MLPCRGFSNSTPQEQTSASAVSETPIAMSRCNPRHADVLCMETRLHNLGQSHDSHWGLHPWRAIAGLLLCSRCGQGVAGTGAPPRNILLHGFTSWHYEGNACCSRVPTHICRLITKLHTHNTCKEHFQGSVGGRSLPQFHPKFRASWMKHMPRNILFHRLTSWNYQGNACWSRMPAHICRCLSLNGGDV